MSGGDIPLLAGEDLPCLLGGLTRTATEDPSSTVTGRRGQLHDMGGNDPENGLDDHEEKEHHYWDDDDCLDRRRATIASIPISTEPSLARD